MRATDTSQRTIALILADKLPHPPSEAELTELTALFVRLTADLGALDELDLCQVEPAVVFTFVGARDNER